MPPHYSGLDSFDLVYHTLGLKTRRHCLLYTVFVVIFVYNVVRMYDELVYIPKKFKGFMKRK